MFPINKSDKIEIPMYLKTSDELPFYCVSTMKLSILSIATFGLYELFWFYKNWSLIKARSGRDIRPFWRAIFSPLYCYSFATTVNSAAESANVVERIKSGPIALLYAGLIIFGNLPEDPYWLISLFSFVPLIPIARQIRKVQEAIRPGLESAIGWNRWSYLTLVVGGIVVGFSVISIFGPPTRALRHYEIPSSFQVALVEAGVLEPEEHIHYFYTAGFFSILEDGNLLTEKRVISYMKADGELYVYSSPYSEIREYDVTYSDSFFDHTVITISTMDGDEFELIVSTEDGGDKEFVSTLKSLLTRGP